MRAVFPARDCGWNHLDTSPSGIKNSFPALPSHRPPGLFHGNFNVLPWKSRYDRVHSLQFFHNLNIKLERERESMLSDNKKFFSTYLGRRGSKDSWNSFLSRYSFSANKKTRFSEKKFEIFKTRQKDRETREMKEKRFSRTLEILLLILFPRHRVHTGWN